MRFAAIDIGNSRVKILSKEHGSVAFPVDELDDTWFDELRSFIQKHKSPYSWALSSVNSKVEEDIIDMLIEFSPVIIAAEFILNNQTLIDISQVSGAGSDRIFGVIGATNYSKPPFITVDCGTAITINYLDKNSTFRGGAILPGVSTQLRALNQFTEQLPLLLPEYTDLPFGSTTMQAMTVGTLWSAVGAIKEIISRIKSSAGIQSIPIVFTGGEHQLLASALSDMEIISSPNLVLEGILTAQISLPSETDFSQNI